METTVLVDVVEQPLSVWEMLLWLGVPAALLLVFVVVIVAGIQLFVSPRRPRQ